MSTSRLFPWVTVALCVHGAAFAASDRPAPTKAWSGPPLEVELAAPVDPEPAPPAALDPGLEEKAMDTLPLARPSSKGAPRPGAAPPAVARAAKVGALLTSGEAADSDDPVAFLSDPNGGVYGSGVVAQGGQIEHGAGPLLGAPVPAAEPSREKVDAAVPIANLGRAPSLDEPDACRGFFPAEAAVDGANVDLVVVVQAEGRVISATIARESPEGEGFGRAARACLLSKRFTPGADRAGRPVTASTGVRVFFTR